MNAERRRRVSAAEPGPREAGGCCSQDTGRVLHAHATTRAAMSVWAQYLLGNPTFDLTDEAVALGFGRLLLRVERELELVVAA